MIQIQHKGELIRLDEKTGLFLWSDIKSKEMDFIKRAIDKVQKQSVRRSVILKEGYDAEYKMVTITSRVDTRTFWVVDKDGNRSKRRLEYLYEDSAENKEKIEEIGKIFDQIEKLSRRRHTLEESLAHIKVEKIENA